MAHDLSNWKPLSPTEAHQFMKGLTAPWWIAGGWAIDLFVGRQTRTHGDCDILVLRRDQIAVQEYLRDWELYAADPPGSLRSWSAGEFLSTGVHDIWCRRGPAEPWDFQLMLAEDSGDEWIFRRNPRIRGRIVDMGSVDGRGIPYLVPEIQLLYKARAERSAKDEADFAIVAPLLSKSARKWLISALTQVYPDGHEWVGEFELMEK
jgi:hypothetical protein